MADSTALNTEKKNEINTRLEKYFNRNIDHDIHTLERMIHVNEVYLTLMILMVGGKKVLKEEHC